MKYSDLPVRYLILMNLKNESQNYLGFDPEDDPFWVPNIQVIYRANPS